MPRNSDAIIAAESSGERAASLFARIAHSEKANVG
jgi:hypothetical protein